MEQFPPHRRAGRAGQRGFLVSNLLLPLGSLLFIIFCTTRYGWGWENFLAEANEGKGLKIAKWLRPYMTYVLPVIVGIILVSDFTISSPRKHCPERAHLFRGNFIDLARFTWNLAKNRQESSFCELTGVAPDDIMIT